MYLNIYVAAKAPRLGCRRKIVEMLVINPIDLRKQWNVVKVFKSTVVKIYNIVVPEQIVGQKFTLAQHFFRF